MHENTGLHAHASAEASSAIVSSCLKGCRDVRQKRTAVFHADMLSRPRHAQRRGVYAECSVSAGNTSSVQAQLFLPLFFAISFRLPAARFSFFISSSSSLSIITAG